MHSKRKAFTMIELVFVIVVLGVLAAIAVPRLAATRDDAIIASGRANILAIRSGIISERQARMFRGDSSYAGELDNNTTVQLNQTGQSLFSVVLAQPYRSAGKSGWIKTAHANGGATATYTFRVDDQGKDTSFTYTTANGFFDCNLTAGTAVQQALCASLTQ